MTTSADLLAELREIRDRQNELTHRRDEVIRELMTRSTRVLRADIAAAAGVKEARLYQIAPGGRRPGSLSLPKNLLPELTEHDGLPPFDGGSDTVLVKNMSEMINAQRRNMSEWSILAFIRAVRLEFPEGGFNPASRDDQDQAARRAGYESGSVRLTMARLVMENLAAR
jgi:hypothetical protein